MGIHDLQRGLDALRRALAEVLDSGFDGLEPAPVTAYDGPLRRPARTPDLPWLLAQTSQSAATADHQRRPARRLRASPPPRSRTRPRAAA